MTNSEIRTTKNIKLKEEGKMMKLDLYESRLFGRICYGFGRDEDGYVYIKDDEAIIGSPFMRKSRVTQVLKVLLPAAMNNVSITIVTRPPEDFKDKNKHIVIDCSEQLKLYGIKVLYKSNFHQKFAIIDQSVVWYGSVNFLSFGTNEESIMRFENSDVARQIMDTIL